MEKMKVGKRHASMYVYVHVGRYVCMYVWGPAGMQRHVQFKIPANPEWVNNSQSFCEVQVQKLPRYLCLPRLSYLLL